MQTSDDRNAADNIGGTGSYAGSISYTYDPLGRLTDANELLTLAGGSQVAHHIEYSYDLRGQLTAAEVGNIDANDWSAQYSYQIDGNIEKVTTQPGTDANEVICNFTYDGDLLSEANDVEIGHDLNGNMVVGLTAEFTYNWLNKLRSAQVGSDSMSVRYDPSGNRVWTSRTESGQTTNRKYIVDTVGDLPVILVELDPNSNNSPVRTYVYSGGQVVMQHDGDHTAHKYFYLPDRLGSIRLVIDPNAAVVNSYSYEPFGRTYDAEDDEAIDNPFRFTGQYFDAILAQYHLRGRDYSPQLARLRSRDPQWGSHRQPRTLHPYLYCLNDPVNRSDPSGRSSFTLGSMTAIGIGLTMLSANVANAPASKYGHIPDDSEIMVRDMFGCIVFSGAAHGGGKILSALIRRSIIMQRLLGYVGRITGNSTRGWRVGQPINNLTAKGKVPSWSAVRARYWKNRAYSARSGEFLADDLVRMKRGLAPQRPNLSTGKLESMELHHIPPQSEGGLYNFVEVWPSDHAQLDPWRHYR